MNGRQIYKCGCPPGITLGLKIQETAFWVKLKLQTCRIYVAGLSVIVRKEPIGDGEYFPKRGPAESGETS